MSERPSAASHGPLSWILALLPAALLAAWYWSDGPGPSAADYAQYLGHARALAEGRPYADTGYIFTGLYPYAGPAAQPPGLPLVLWAIYATVGESAIAMKLVLLAFALGFYVVAGRYVAEHADPHLGLGVALLLGVPANVARLSTVPQSDLPFAALVWTIALVYDRPGRFGARRIAAVSVLGAAAVAFRSFGVALVPAALLFTLLRRRQHGLLPAVPVAVWAAGFALANLLFPITVGFRPTMRWLTELPHSVVEHIRWYRYALFEAQLYPFPWDAANDAYHVAATLLMVLGLAAWCRGAWSRFAVLFAAVYVAMLLVVPVLEHRYLWPVAPLVVLGLLNGVVVLARAARAAAVGVPARAGLVTAAGLAALTVPSEAVQPRVRSFADRADVRDLFAVLRQRADRDALRVAFVRPQVLALETRVPSMTTFDDESPARVLEELNRRCITHVVLGGGELIPGDSAFREAVQLHPAGFALEYQNVGFALYRYTALECRREPRRRPEGRSPAR